MMVYSRLFAIGFLLACALAGSLLITLIFGYRGCRAPVLDAPLTTSTQSIPDSL